MPPCDLCYDQASKRCAVCRVTYCSALHQEAEWRRHKTVCGKQQPEIQKLYQPDLRRSELDLYLQIMDAKANTFNSKDHNTKLTLNKSFVMNDVDYKAESLAFTKMSFPRQQEEVTRRRSDICHSLIRLTNTGDAYPTSVNAPYYTVAGLVQRFDLTAGWPASFYKNELYVEFCEELLRHESLLLTSIPDLHERILPNSHSRMSDTLKNILATHGSNRYTSHFTDALNFAKEKEGVWEGIASGSVTQESFAKMASEKTWAINTSYEF